MWPSPYLDAYGEEDIDLRRGKPLFLCQERYASLTAMVLWLCFFFGGLIAQTFML
jgi:hypothetical protein